MIFLSISTDRKSGLTGPKPAINLIETVVGLR